LDYTTYVPAVLGVAGVASLVGARRAEAALPSNLHMPLEVLFGRRAYPLHPDSTVSASYVFNLASGEAAACTVMTAMDRADVASYVVTSHPDTSACDTVIRVWATTIRFADDGVTEAVVPINSLGDTLWTVKKRSDNRWGGKQDYFREDGPYLVIHAVNDDADSVLGLVFSRWLAR